MSTLAIIVIATALSGLLSAACAVVVLLLPARLRARGLPHLVSFATGALLGAALLALLPHAIEGIELLLTKDLTERQLVLGKFLACVPLVLITLLFTLPYYVTVSTLGPLDHGATISGFLALLLMSCAYITIGIWASSITNNQIVAFILALVTIVIIHFIFDVLASGTGGIISTIFSQLSSSRHIDSLSRGVMDIRDIIYFISVTS